MTTIYSVLRVSTLLSIGIAASASPATDRMRPGQWVGTTIADGKKYPTSECMSPQNAVLLNGDAKAVQSYLETTIPPEICRISDVKADGPRVVYTASCTAGTMKTVKTVTSVFFGNRMEGTDSAGGKSDAKLVGPCK